MTFDPLDHIYPLNRSQTNLKLERYAYDCGLVYVQLTDSLLRWDEAAADATKVIDLCPRNLKALLRRGRARKELGKWDAARAGKDSSEILRFLAWMPITLIN